MKNIIKKILKEESNMPVQVRRRLPYVENIFIDKIKNYYKPESLRRFESGKELLDVVSNSVLDTIYHEAFSNYDVFSKEWEKIWTYMKNHLKDKYKDEVERYYHLNTGN